MTSQTTIPPSPQHSTKQRVRRTQPPGDPSLRLGLAVLAVALFAFFSLRSERFFASANVINIALSMSTIAIIIIGSAALLIAGNVDLSVGSMYALVAVCVGQVAHKTGNIWLAIVVGLVLGFVLGATNGILVRLLKLSPLIVTIGSLAIMRGVAFVVTDGRPVYDYPQSFLDIGRARYLGVPFPVWVAVASFVIGAVVIVRTRSGLHLYAIGSDDRSAQRNGVNVNRTVIMTYAINGALVGLAAVLTAARLGSVSPNLGEGLEFDVITAAILGGVAFAGGSGRPIGIAVGVATIGILNAGLLFEGLRDFWQKIAKGVLLLAALGADQLLSRRRHRGAIAAESLGSPPGEPDGAVGLETGPMATLEPVRGASAPRRSFDRVVLRAKGLTRTFGAVRALDDVDITVRAGEVVCLLGDNGAGKSTFIKLLSGADRADGGRVEVDGVPVSLDTPRHAHDVGIHTVYQDLALAPSLSVTHNFVLGDEPTWRPLGVLRFRDDAEAERRTAVGLKALNIQLADYRIAVKDLSGGQRQALAIARAVQQGAKLLILDEPTAALGVSQTANVRALVRSVADRGAGVILITHDVQTVRAVSDSVVVLRLGRVVHQGPTADLDDTDLLHLMAGLPWHPMASG